MNVAEITMPADQAREQLEQYQAALQTREPTDEDRGVILGLKAIAKGRSLIDLHDVFRRCPADAKGRPALAVARAHWRRVRLEVHGNGGSWWIPQIPGLSFWDLRPGRGALKAKVAWHRQFRLPAGTLPETIRPPGEHRAVVPLIPPNLRPARGLNRYCILWEAEWGTVPADPMLIRHLHGSLYVVLACWDLTALERAVLSGRLTEPPK